MTRGGRLLAVSVVALATLLAACSSDGGSSDSAPTTAAATTGAPTSAAPTTPASTTVPATTEAPTTTAAAAAEFEKVVPGGDCICADGSEFSYWVKEADPAKVVFYFQGGGACFSTETCAFQGGTYKVQAENDDPNTVTTGIFDQANPANPLAGWSVVYVPYCTGDVHFGNGTHDYGNGLVVNHKGYVNGTAALQDLVERFPDASEVVVTGESAGGVPTPLFAGLVADDLPAAKVVAIADSSGAYPDVPAVNAAIGGLWGTMNAVPPWPQNADATPENWSIPGLFVRAGTHNPKLTLARHDYAFDRVQGTFAGLAGLDASNLLQLIDGNETKIEAAGVPLSSFVAPGTNHTVFSQDAFYTETVAGVKLVDWVTDLVEGTPVTDIHCTDCKGS